GPGDTGAAPSPVSAAPLGSVTGADAAVPGTVAACAPCPDSQAEKSAISDSWPVAPVAAAERSSACTARACGSRNWIRPEVWSGIIMSAYARSKPVPLPVPRSPDSRRCTSCSSAASVVRTSGESLARAWAGVIAYHCRSQPVNCSTWRWCAVSRVWARARRALSVPRSSSRRAMSTATSSCAMIPARNAVSRFAPRSAVSFSPSRQASGETDAAAPPSPARAAGDEGDAAGTAGGGEAAAEERAVAGAAGPHRTAPRVNSTAPRRRQGMGMCTAEPFRGEAGRQPGRTWRERFRAGHGSGEPYGVTA
ncbi:hypothetical protein CF54_35690, partial [Streptomyces sp. Tu 6176]